MSSNESWKDYIDREVVRFYQLAATLSGVRSCSLPRKVGWLEVDAGDSDEITHLAATLSVDVLDIESETFEGGKVIVRWKKKNQ